MAPGPAWGGVAGPSTSSATTATPPRPAWGRSPVASSSPSPASSSHPSPSPSPGPSNAAFPTLAASASRPASKTAARRAPTWANGGAQTFNPYRPRIAEINERAAARLSHALDLSSRPTFVDPGDDGPDVSLHLLGSQADMDDAESSLMTMGASSSRNQGMSSVTFRDEAGRLLGTTAPDIYRRVNQPHVQAKRRKRVDVEGAQAGQVEVMPYTRDIRPAIQAVALGGEEKNETTFRDLLIPGPGRPASDVWSSLARRIRQHDASLVDYFYHEELEDEATWSVQELHSLWKHVLLTLQAQLSIHQARQGLEWSQVGIKAAPSKTSSYRSDAHLADILEVCRAVHESLEHLQSIGSIRLAADDSSAVLAMGAPLLLREYDDVRKAARSIRQDEARLLSCPFLFTLETKSQLIWAFVHRQHDECERAWLRSRMFSSSSLDRSSAAGGAPTYEGLLIDVQRNDIIASTRRALLREVSTAWDEVRLRAPLKVRFQEEMGDDTGGLRREWLHLILDALVTGPDAKLFEPIDADDPSSPLQLRLPAQEPENLESDMELLGIVLGLALTHENVQTMPLLRHFFTTLVTGEALPRLGLLDLESEAPALARMVGKPDGPSREEWVVLGEMGYLSNLPITAPLTFDRPSRENVIRRLATRKLRERGSSNDQRRHGLALEALSSGFRRVVPEPVLDLLDVETLQKLLNNEDLDSWPVVAIRPLTAEIGFTSSVSDRELLQAFWEYWAEADRGKRRRILKYTTGSDRMPRLPNLSMVSSDVPPVAPSPILRLHAVDATARAEGRLLGQAELLPYSSTCTSTLFLPRYEDPKRSLPQKFDVALRFGAEGFGLM